VGPVEGRVTWMAFPQKVLAVGGGAGTSNSSTGELEGKAWSDDQLSNSYDHQTPSTGCANG
jgi:hypothetical protein